MIETGKQEVLCTGYVHARWLDDPVSMAEFEGQFVRQVERHNPGIQFALAMRDTQNPMLKGSGDKELLAYSFPKP